MFVIAPSLKEENEKERRRGGLLVPIDTDDDENEGELQTERPKQRVDDLEMKKKAIDDNLSRATKSSLAKKAQDRFAWASDTTFRGERLGWENNKAQARFTLMRRLALAHQQETEGNYDESRDVQVVRGPQGMAIFRNALGFFEW